MNTMKRIVPVRGVSKIWKLADEERELPTNWPEVSSDCLAVWQPNPEATEPQFKGQFLSSFGGDWSNPDAQRGHLDLWYLIDLAHEKNRPILDHLGIPATLPKLRHWKMRVNHKELKAIQERVFALQGQWNSGRRKLKETTVSSEIPALSFDQFDLMFWHHGFNWEDNYNGHPAPETSAAALLAAKDEVWFDYGDTGLTLPLPEPESEPKSYAQLQAEWLRENFPDGIVGKKVRVLPKTEPDGWQNSWSNYMDDMHGSVLEVKRTCKLSGIVLEDDEGYPFGFPYTSLEPAPEPKQDPAIVGLNGIVKVENTNLPIYRLADEVRELPVEYPDVDGPCLLVWQPNSKPIGAMYLAGYSSTNPYSDWLFDESWEGIDSGWYLIPLARPENKPILQHLGVMEKDEPEAVEPEPALKGQEPGRLEPIMPERDWIERRVSEICHAILRFNEAGKPAKPEWLDELGRHNDWLNADQRGREYSQASDKPSVRRWKHKDGCFAGTGALHIEWDGKKMWSHFPSKIEECSCTIERAERMVREGYWIEITEGGEG